MKGVRILLSTEISKNDLHIAEGLLDVFVMKFEEYYGMLTSFMNSQDVLNSLVTARTGEKNCVINLHLLTHLSYYVELCGPLWTYSAFGYESFMGALLQLTHSTHDIGKQVINNNYVGVCFTLLYLLRWLLLNKRLKPLRISICSSDNCSIFLMTFLKSFDEE